ncbi:MAG: primosomal protein N' [Patescibacteria group bacterium]
MIAQVVPEIRTAKEKQFYSYNIPEDFVIKIGSIVYIPFGDKKIRGVVIGLNKEKPAYKTKDIERVEEKFSLPNHYIDLAKWISSYYLCSLGESISLFMPPVISRPRMEETNVNCDIKTKTLSEEQKKIFESLKAKFADKNKKPALLYGVTGSGKTEVYIKLAEEARKSGKQIIVLVPEIILTPQTVERFSEVFGDDICLMHSGLSDSEKYYCYKNFYEGKKGIIIGPRSALLVPSKNLGLIIVDEEQEEAYKQDHAPRYHTGEVAEVLAKKTNALLVFGSATPRVESFFRADSGIYDLFELKSRYQKLIMPVAEVVDLKSEMRSGNYSPISERMQKEIAKTLSNKKQVLLFLNRRGQSTFTSCRECGEVINCSNCDIPLISYGSGKYENLRCHHCDYSISTPSKCPNCKSSKIKSFGSGVERIEAEICKLFPRARIFRVDSTTIKNKKDHKKLYRDLKDHKIDIVIGTQMLSKGFDIPGIDLVGIISADVGLHLPQFRSSEKTFRVITQVSGRSGRTHNVGRTIIQTYWPGSRAIKYAATHDYKKFYSEEINHRKKLNYPPFSHIVRIVSEDRNEKRARSEIEKITKELEISGIEFIGPGMCFFQKLNNRCRLHAIIKISKLPSEKLAAIYHKFPYVIWDVDPIDML